MLHRFFTGIGAAVGILVLILDAKAAILGAKEGLILCFEVIIPSLFPFFVLSILLTGSLSGRGAPVLRPLGRLLGIPAGGEGIFLTGLLGGYPTGAQAVAQSFHAGQLSEDAAKRMLGFCSNAGPAFFFGVLALQFPKMWMVWALWIIHILSALLVGITLPGKDTGRCEIAATAPITLPQALKKAIGVTANVCGWVILFRVILYFAGRWFLWMMPQGGQVGIYGFLELANGCCQLHLLENIGMRFVCCCAMMAFGGLCVGMQTASVAGSLGMGAYWRGKVMQTLYSFLIGLIFQMIFFAPNEKWALSPVIPFLIIGFFVIGSAISRRSKNKSSFPRAIGV